MMTMVIMRMVIMRIRIIRMRMIIMKRRVIVVMGPTWRFSDSWK